MKHTATGRRDAPGLIQRLFAAVICMAPSSLALGATPPALDNSSFEHYCEVDLPAERDGVAWLAVTLSPGVFDQARPDLADLRLCVAGEPAVPYTIRILEPRRVDTVLEAKVFDRVRGNKDAVELSLDLGENPPEHNQLEVDLPGINYRRRVELDAADKPGDWKRLAEGNFIDFRAAGHEVHESKLSYPPSRFRYLRASVFPDPQVDLKPLDVAGARVHYFVDEPGEMLESPASVDSREAAPVLGGPGSRWVIQLAARNLPVDTLLCDPSDPEFARNYMLETGMDIDGQTVYASFDSGLWTRRHDEPAQPLPLRSKPSFPLGRLRLAVTDYANPPLTITAARTRGATRELVFANTTELRGPLRLYFGDPQAQAPHYDLERRLPEKLDPPPQRLQLGDVQQNPTYVPPLVPLTERWPWTIYLVLSVSAISLAAVLVNLGRRMIESHDAKEAAAAPQA